MTDGWSDRYWSPSNRSGSEGRTAQCTLRWCMWCSDRASDGYARIQSSTPVPRWSPSQSYFFLKMNFTSRFHRPQSFQNSGGDCSCNTWSRYYVCESRAAGRLPHPSLLLGHQYLSSCQFVKKRQRGHSVSDDLFIIDGILESIEMAGGTTIL